MSVVTSAPDNEQLINIITSLNEDCYSVLSCKKGDYIYMPDEESDKFFFLQSGRVMTGSYSDEGKMMIKTMILSGTFFGELGIIGQKTRNDFALTKDECRVLVFPIGKLRDILSEHSDFYLHLMSSLGYRLMKTEKRLENMVFKNSRSRIVEFLYGLGKDFGQQVGYETLVRDFFTHQEIADLTGTSRQTVTTTLNDLRNHNIISFNRKRLLIRDLEKLRQVEA